MAIVAITALCVAAVAALAWALGVEVLFYRARTKRFGVGPVGESWRDTIGISGGAFGYAVAIYRWPADVDEQHH